MNDLERKLFLETNIIFKDKFPDNYINDVKGWGIDKSILHTKLNDGTSKLLTLDIDVGNQCSLNCPHCFRKSKELNTNAKSLSVDEILNIIKEAKKLGLKSVKILGAGEPFENPDFYRFLVEANKLNITVAVFTKGHVLGSDKLTKKYFSNYGFDNSIDFIHALKKLDVSILFGFNSFNKERQDHFIGTKTNSWKYADDYCKIRNVALLNLIKTGFNEYNPAEPTRLALIPAPIKPLNIDEIFTIYKWGRRRHIYVLSCPTTYSGLGKKEYQIEKGHNFEKYLSDLKNLYKKIYVWNIKNNLMTKEQFIEEGVGLYPGCHPCNQVAGGFYITLKGKVIRCPGRDDKSSTECEDIHSKDLKEVWKKSKNYTLSQNSGYNYQCIARDGYFFEKPKQFYNSIFNMVLKEIR